MFRFAMSFVAFCAAASASAADSQVEAVNAIYRTSTDDVLFRVEFSRKPELPIANVSWEIWNNETFNSFVTIQGSQISSDIGTIPVNCYERRDGSWRITEANQIAFALEGVQFSAVVPFSLLHVDSPTFLYQSIVITDDNDEGTFQTNYSTINVPEPSCLALAICGLCVAIFAMRSKGVISPPSGEYPSRDRASP